jgi:hypothetical protein
MKFGKEKMQRSDINECCPENKNTFTSEATSNLDELGLETR